jgi:hypothetical protein
MTKIYTNIGAEIYISAMLKILKRKGIIKDNEFEEVFAESLQEYRDGKFIKMEVNEK